MESYVFECELALNISHALTSIFFAILAALYLIGVSVIAGFWGQSSIRKLVAVLKRASLIVFILSAVIFASALTMGTLFKHHLIIFHFQTY